MITVDGKKARVCIDPGHGGGDPGAIGPTGLREEDINLKVSKELMYALDLLGIDSELTRTEDKAVALSERVQASKDCHAFISIHCNSHSSQAEGIETVFSSKAGLHKALANNVQQALLKCAPGHKNRGIKMSPSMDYPRSLFVLTNSLVPSALVELEFISNLEQEKWLSAEETHGKVANALADGIKSFLMSLPGSVFETPAKLAEVPAALAPTPAPKIAEMKPEPKQIPVVKTKGKKQKA